MPNNYLYILPELRLLQGPMNDSSGVNGVIGRERSMIITKVEELYAFDVSIIISEPGNGKSRLLKEIILKAGQNKYAGIYIDLKKIKWESIEESIKRFIKMPAIRAYTNKDINSAVDYLHSDGFTVNHLNELSIICLDAFDEVKKDDQLDLINKIKEFKITYPNTHIVVSCRDHIYRKVESSFTGLSPKVIEVCQFTRAKVIQYLEASDFDEREVGQVIDHFFRDSEMDVIHCPRILEIFVSIKEREGLESAMRKGNAELLDTFIYENLGVEDAKYNRDQRDIVKRVLETLALTMEIYQSKIITRDELLTFFDDVKSDLKIPFLQNISLENIYERVLIPVENGVQFSNAEFQEYLAAKEITRMGKLDQAFFDLSVEGRLREILPSWSNTLKYLIELHPNLQQLVLDFILSKENSSDFHIVDLIILTNENKISHLSIVERKSIFCKVLYAATVTKTALSYSLARKIALYFTEDTDLLGRATDDLADDKYLTGNIIRVLEFLIGQHRIKNTSLWEELLGRLLKNTGIPQWIREGSMNALAKLHNLSLLRENFKYETELNSSIRYTYINACIEADPNDLYSIDLIIKVIKAGDINILPRPDFDSVTTKGGFKYLLSKFLEDEELFSDYRPSGFEKYKQKTFIENLNNIYDNEIENLITAVVEKHAIYLEHNGFMRQLLQLVKRKNNDYIFILEKKVRITGAYMNNAYEYNKIFEVLLTNDNTIRFIENMISIVGAETAIITLFLPFEFVTENGQERIFEISKMYFGDKYEEIEKNRSQRQLKRDQSEEKYQQFIAFLQPTSGLDKFYWDVLYFYNQNKEIIEKRMDAGDRDKLTRILKEKILKFDFSKATIVKETISPGTSQYRISNMVKWFGEAIPIFSAMGLEAKDYRMKIIEFLPFYLSNDNCQSLFKLVPSLEADEIEYLVEFYQQERTDDVIQESLRNLFNACRNYRLKELSSFLEKLVLDANIELYKRLEALDVIHFLGGNYPFFSGVFKVYRTSEGQERELAIKGNEYLIDNKNDTWEEAVAWRINEIKSNPIGKEPEDCNGFLDHQIELGMANLSRPLLVLDDEKLIPQFEDLLDRSIEISRSSDNHRTYVAHLWTIVMKYFENLKKNRSYDPLTRLEERISRYGAFGGASLLRYYLNRVKVEYINSLSKLESYSDCIKIYNEIKTRKYLNVSTSLELYYLVEKIIDDDLRRWIVQEGGLEVLNYDIKKKGTKGKSQMETFIQMTVKTQFEGYLLKRGLRDSEVRIYRESVLLSGEKPDFNLAYGFVGQIVVEIKLAKNPEASDDTKALQYKNKMLKYVEGSRADYGFLLILQTEEEHDLREILPRLKNIYDGEKKISVVGIDCFNIQRKSA